MKKNNITAFAKMCGVKITKCAPINGADFLYHEEDNPHIVVGPFRTEYAAYEHWIDSAFGSKIGCVIRNMLNR